ncbi:hypothetical protein Tco_0293966, partial [Tanacetum coccineum]
EFDEEEYEELYGDVNISLKDIEPADKEKVNKEMNVAGQIYYIGKKKKKEKIRGLSSKWKRNSLPLNSLYSLTFKIYDCHNEVACLMLGSMTPELQRQFENYSPYGMLQELKSNFEKEAGV